MPVKTRRISGDFPTILLRLCRSRGISNAAAARIIGISPQKFSAYVNGHQQPNMSTVKRVASTFAERLSVFIDC